MLLKLTVTFDPFVVSAPDLHSAIMGVKGAEGHVTVESHPARQPAKPRPRKVKAEVGA